jgi:hypothetical protein
MSQLAACVASRAGRSLHVLAEDPDSNRSIMIVATEIAGRRIRLLVPAQDLILRIHAKFKDGAERCLSYPVVFGPGFRSAKTLHVTLTSVEGTNRYSPLLRESRKHEQRIGLGRFGDPERGNSFSVPRNDKFHLITTTVKRGTCLRALLPCSSDLPSVVLSFGRWI